MSNRILNFIWDHSPSKGTELLVLLSLADQANDDGECWPSIRSLCRRSRIERRYARRILTTLAARGEIQIERRRRSDQSHTSNLYRIIIPPDTASVYRSNGTGPETPRGWSTDPEGRGLQTTRGGSTDPEGRGLQTSGEGSTDHEVGAGKPSREPSFNPQLNREMNREDEPLSQTPLSELIKAKSKTPKKGGDR